MDYLQAERETARIAAKLYSRCLETLDEMPHDVTAAQGPSLNLHEYYDLLASLAPQVRGNDFYLSLGSRYDITDLGVLGYALISADNLQRSWELTFHASSLLVHPLGTRRRVEHDRIVVELYSPGTLHKNWQWAYEEWLSGTWKWMCQRLPQIAENDSLVVNLAYPEPEYGARYREIFPGEVNFNSARTELSFPEAWYQLPFPSASPTVALACEQQCLSIMAQMEIQSDLVQSVRRKLLLNPQPPLPSVADMAAQFRLPSHTFHRRLKKEGMNYQTIVTEVRMELAKDYLKNTALHLQEISYLLGYEHPPSFYRAFRKWVGRTPQEYRTIGSA